MKSNDFCYWLKGLFELTDIFSLSDKQLSLIKSELEQVFKNDKKPNSFCIELNSVFKFDEHILPDASFVSNLKIRLQEFYALNTVEKKTTHKVELSKDDGKAKWEAMC